MADPTAQIHDLAVQAEGVVEQLATELAHAGVDKGAVQQVTQCATILRGIVQAVGGAQPAPQQPSGQDPLGQAVGQFHQQQVAAAQGPG